MLVQEESGTIPLEEYLLNTSRQNCLDLAHMVKQDKGTLRTTIMKLFKHIDADERLINAYSYKYKNELNGEFWQLIKKLDQFDENMFPIESVIPKKKSFLTV